jgi:hypothetical protein
MPAVFETCIDRLQCDVGKGEQAQFTDALEYGQGEAEQVVRGGGSFGSTRLNGMHVRLAILWVFSMGDSRACRGVFAEYCEDGRSGGGRMF